MKVQFIVNPVAGKGLALKKVSEINKAVGNYKDVEYDIVYTERSGHAIELARRGAENNVDIVFAVGGDGTVNEVANGLVGTDTALAVIPGGSGNDFIRSLGVEGDTMQIIHDTLGGSRKVIDVGKIDGRYFINIASAGFDAEVVMATQRAKKLFLSGSMAYLAGLISTIFTRKSDNVVLNMDDRRIEGKMLLTAVANGRYYGGGMKAAPDAVMDDGLFDICFISSVSKIRMLFLFPQFIKGKHAKLREVNFYRARKVSIESKKQMPINVDGEVYMDSKACFELIKDGLIIAVPSYIQ